MISFLNLYFHLAIPMHCIFFRFFNYFRNTLIAKGFNKTVSFENDTLYKKCSADCPLSTKTSLYEGLTMTDVLGDPKMSIRRNEPDFHM